MEKEMIAIARLKSGNCKNCNCKECKCDGSKVCACPPESTSCCCNN